MKIYIVRHGEKKSGAYFNHYLGHKDQPLSDAGEKSAKKLVDYFKQMTIKKIIASEYLRTFETAYYVALDKGLEVVRDKRLNEIDNGLIDMLSVEEIQLKYPEFWSDFMQASKDVRFPGGETGEEVRLRQNDLLNELIQAGEDTILFSHEGYMRLLMCTILDLPVYKRRLFKVDFCGIIELEYHTELKAWQILKCNQTANS